MCIFRSLRYHLKHRVISSCLTIFEETESMDWTDYFTPVNFVTAGSRDDCHEEKFNQVK